MVLTFSVLFTFTDFQLVYAITRGGAGELDASDGDAWRSSGGYPGGQLGEGAAIAVAMIPFLVAATLMQLFRAGPAQVAAGGRQ